MICNHDRYILTGGLKTELSKLLLVGTGLTSGDVSRAAVEVTKACQTVFWENYTNVLPGITSDEIAELFGPGVIRLDRERLEDGSVVLEALSRGDVALLVHGDPMISTTHISLRVQAAGHGHESRIIHSSSIISAAMGESCLQSTRFGRVATISFHHSEQPYDVLVDNLERGLHTLFLLDLDVEGGRFMTIAGALKVLSTMEALRTDGIFSDDTLVVGLARVSSEDQIIRAGPAKRISKIDFGDPPHSLIVPGSLHFAESEAIGVLLDL
jgi:diphthine synthase